MKVEPSYMLIILMKSQYQTRCKQLEPKQALDAPLHPRQKHFVNNYSRRATYSQSTTQALYILSPFKASTDI